MAVVSFLPFLCMVLVQVGYAGMNIVSKLAMNSGMNPFIQVAYRQIFASLAIIPFAYFLEKKTRPKMTLPILFQILLSSTFGVTINQITYFVGLKNSTPTIACALTNLLPAFTFLMAIPFRLESVGVRTKAGQAKIVGTIVCVGGAMLLSFYHGSIIPIGESKIHWTYILQNSASSDKSGHANFMLGPFMLIASPISWAVWFIIQAKMSDVYPPYSSSALICVIASVQCVLVGLVADHKLSSWSLLPGIRAISSIYTGVVCTALAYCLMSWCIKRKGPLYVSVFGPLGLVVVAILSWALLQEKLYAGTVSGSILIVMGLYAVLLGKNMELMNPKDAKITDIDSELSEIENGDFNFPKN